MQYQLKELFDNLAITLTELKRRSGISDVTLISIRNGHSARRSTINTLLQTFSEIYGVKLTLKNVEGIIIQGKPVSSVAKQEPVPPTSDVPVVDTPKKKASQKGSESDSSGIPADLPQGSVKLVDFVIEHGLSDSSVGRWIDTGLKGEKLQTEKRIGRNGRTQHFLTPELQVQALDLLRRHGKLKDE